MSFLDLSESGARPPTVFFKTLRQFFTPSPGNVRTRFYLSKADMRAPEGLSLPLLAIVYRFRKETHVLTFAVYVNISFGRKYTHLQRTDSRGRRFDFRT